MARNAKKKKLAKFFRKDGGDPTQKFGGINNENLWCFGFAKTVQNGKSLPWGDIFLHFSPFQIIWVFFGKKMFILFSPNFLGRVLCPSKIFRLNFFFAFLAILDHFGHFWKFFFWIFSELFWVGCTPPAFFFEFFLAYDASHDVLCHLLLEFC